jgi:hypothetical protein
MKNIYKALADFQQEVPVIHKDTQGYGYSYADLPTIFEKINPLMQKHGLGFYQAVNGTQIKTVVFHIESGETIESNTDIPQGVQLAKMNDFQVLGSAVTYIRRYALSSILGLVTDKDTDASGEQKREAPQNATISPKQALEGAKKAIADSTTLEELNSIGEQIKASKNIPDRRSQEGKDMRNELAQLFANKAKELSNNEVPFE